MVREEVIGKLAQLAGPLGPFETPETRQQEQETWFNHLQIALPELIEHLLDALIHPPEAMEIHPAGHEDFEFELSGLLTLLGQRDPGAMLERIGPLLANKEARPAVIEIIGGLQTEEGIRWLAPFVYATQLTEDELIRLACALGEIGGASAKLLLEQMQQSVPAEMTDVFDEIDIALHAMPPGSKS